MATSSCFVSTCMDEQRLYRIIDFILNNAESQELDVIRAALRRREEHEGGQGLRIAPQSLAGNIRNMATDMAAQVSGQIGVNKDQIRKSVRGFVQELIEREAPNLDRKQVQELMDEWVPDGDLAARRQQQEREKSSSLPADVLLTMIQQFISFSTGSLTVSEEAGLKKAMPNWQRTYWQRFPRTIRKLAGLFLKGIIGEGEFWSGVSDELGIDPRSSSSPS